MIWRRLQYRRANFIQWVANEIDCPRTDAGLCTGHVARLCANIAVLVDRHSQEHLRQTGGLSRQARQRPAPARMAEGDGDLWRLREEVRGRAAYDRRSRD